MLTAACSSPASPQLTLAVPGPPDEDFAQDDGLRAASRGNRSPHHGPQGVSAPFQSWTSSPSKEHRRPAPRKPPSGAKGRRSKEPSTAGAAGDLGNPASLTRPPPAQSLRGAHARVACAVEEVQRATGRIAKGMAAKRIGKANATQASPRRLAQRAADDKDLGLQWAVRRPPLKTSKYPSSLRYVFPATGPEGRHPTER